MAGACRKHPPCQHCLAIHRTCLKAKKAETNVVLRWVGIVMNPKESEWILWVSNGQQVLVVKTSSQLVWHSLRPLQPAGHRRYLTLLHKRQAPTVDHHGAWLHMQMLWMANVVDYNARLGLRVILLWILPPTLRFASEGSEETPATISFMHGCFSWRWFRSFPFQFVMSICFNDFSRSCDKCLPARRCNLLAFALNVVNHPKRFWIYFDLSGLFEQVI